MMERYDRQVRLWGQHGQIKCSKSKICLINADSIGVETLKGLCLAGIGSFIILDSYKLTPEDVGCSFIPQNSVGKSRGEVAKLMLLDLNDEVNGQVLPLETCVPHASQNQISDNDQEANQDFWMQFNCVIVSGLLHIGQIIRLSQICWNLNTPMILCKSVGFNGFMRTQIKEHIVTETHHDWRPPNHEDNVIVKTRPIYEEYDCEFRSCEDEKDEFVTILLCLKALDSFYSRYGRLPGCRDENVETDIGLLKDCVKQTTGRSSNQLKSLDECLYELCLYGGAELYATSAFMGGCIAQEVIKMVTNQYVPVDDTLVYSAVSATTRSFKSSEIFGRQPQ